MKRILLLLLLFSSFGLSADSSKSLTINNLEITVTGEYKVEVYKGMKHMFSFDCRPYISCEIFTTSKQDPSYKLGFKLMKRLLLVFLMLSSNLFAEQGETILIIPQDICDIGNPYTYNLVDIEREIAEFEANLAKELADKAAQEMMAEIEAESGPVN